MSTNIDIINAALTLTGNEPITSLQDGSVESMIALMNYDLLIESELGGYRWKWATKTQALSHIDGEPAPPWTHAWQLPADVVLLRAAKVNGRPIKYELQSRTLLCHYDADSPVIAHYTWTVPEAYWPGFFKKLIIMRLEAIFLRGKERYEEGQARDKDASNWLREARLLDAQSQPPVNPHKSKILRARGGGGPGLEMGVSDPQAFDEGFD